MDFTSLSWRQRVVCALAAVSLLILFYSGIYTLLIGWTAGEQISFLHAVQVVVEALTTAGFGGDTGYWNSDLIRAYVILMNLTGVLLVFLALPAFVIPLLQERLERRVPRETDLSDHVIVCSYAPQVEVLGDELDAAGIPYLVIEDDPADVRSLNEQGVEAIQGDPETRELFERANTGSARAVVVNVSTDRNPSVILTAREAHDSIPIVTVAENENTARYHRFAGANNVVQPRQALGHCLGIRAAGVLSHALRNSVELGEELELTELVVESGSELVGQSLRELRLREELGATILGIWSEGEFEPVPEPNRILQDQDILLVSGVHEDLESLSSQTDSPDDVPGGFVCIAGFGEVGRSVKKTLEEESIPTRVIDREDKEGVDVVGDVRDPDALRQVSVDQARSVVLCTGDDTRTIYATLAAREVDPEVEVIARATRESNVRKIYRAGAGYVQSLPTITGRMLSAHLIEGEEMVTPEMQFEVIRTVAGKLGGETLQSLDLRAETGATLVAIERGDELIDDFGPDFVLDEEDVLILTGSDAAVNQALEWTRG